MGNSEMSSPIFIVGAQRSGTTLLRLMLNAHSQIAIPEEGTFWMPLLRRFKQNTDRIIDKAQLQRYFQYIERNTQFSLWGMNPANVFERIEQKDGGCTLAELMSGLYEAYAQCQDKTVWGDKTPSFFRMVPVLADLFPKARFINIIRDGRDIYLSWRRLDPTKKNVSVSAAEWLFKLYKAGNSLKTISQSRRLETRYEDLVADPDATLRNICKFLDVEYEDAMLNFWKTSDRYIGRHHSDLIFRPVSHESICKWKKQFTRREIANFQFIAKKALKSYGYELSPVCSDHTETFFDVSWQLAWGLPHRAFQVIHTALDLDISARFGLQTKASGKGEAPEKARKTNNG